MDPGRARGLEALCRDGVDWRAVLRLARRHGVTPLLHRHLGAVGPGRVPPAVLEELRGDHEANAVRNRFLAARLRAALDALAEAGVVALAFKGPTLALGAYGDLSLRRFEDLDLLVRREDVPACKRQLLAHGYRPLRELTDAEEARYLDSEYEYGFVGDRGRVRVELHWNVVPRAFSFQLDMDRLCKAARPMTLDDGSPVLVPAPEDLLLILSLHGAKHLWERVGWICDIAELVRAHPDLDWPGCLAEARARGVERIVLVALFLAEDLLGAVLPAEVAGRVRRDRAVAALGRRVAGWLAAGAVPTQRSRAGLRFATAVRERVADRVRYAARLTLTPTIDDWAGVRLPAWLFFLHYPLRPLRLAVKYGTRALVGR
jgi:hypothetical protein